MGEDARDHRPLAAPATHPPSVASNTIRRQTSKVGAGCLNRARPALCGGRSVMSVPTAIDRLYRLANLCCASPMTRIARVVVPGLPHHVTQRGARRERVFFEDGDYALYRDWLGQSCRRFGVDVSCLLPDAEPRSPDPDARGRRGLGAGALADAPPCRVRQRPRAPDRPSVSGPVRLGRA